MAKAPKKDAKQKKPRLPKEPTAPKAAKKPAPKIFNNDDPEAKALFLQHLPKVKTERDKVATATADLRNAYKAAKAHGFDKIDFDHALELESAEKEAKARAKIARQLVIARYMGSDLGAQLDMFLEPDRTPAADRAYNEGQTASMKNEPAKPSYAPETEQYREYMAGFHDDQQKIATNGIKKLHPDVAKDVKETKAAKAKVDKQKAEDAKQFQEPISSGTPLTRAEFEAMQQQPQSHFQKA